MQNVVSLNRIPANNTVLRRLPHLSPDAMRFMLALLAFRGITGRAGIIRMSEIIAANGITPTSAIINELFDAGVMGQGENGIVVYHPIIQAMMAPVPIAARDSQAKDRNVIQLPVRKRGVA
jgi:hypothetical protein